MKKILLIIFIITSLQTKAQNTAVNFDGVDDYITTSLSLTSSYTSFTVESWIYYTSTTNNTNIIGQNGTLEVAFINSSLYIYINTNNGWLNTSYTIDGSFPSSTWNHFAITGDGTTTKIYINGILKVSTSMVWANLVNLGNTFKIGGNTQSPVVYFTGKMEEVRIWNTARSITDIKQNMFNKNLSNGVSSLIAYYRFNEGSGTAAANSCTNTAGIDGTLTNGPTWATSPVQFAKNALDFDGTNDYVDCPSLGAITDLTFETWVKPTSLTLTSSFKGIMMTDSWTIGSVHLQFRNLNFAVAVNPTVDFFYSYDFTPHIGQWVHIAVAIHYVSGASTFKLYVNGVLQQTVTDADYTGFTVSAFNIGSWGNSRYFDGSIDDYRIWNVVRTDAQISSNYLNEIDPTTSGLVAYYNFNQGIAEGTNTGLTTLVDNTGSNNGTITNFGLTTGAASNYVAQNTSLPALPLQWHGFTAKKQNNKVLLDWSTVQEQNTKDFIAQHSTNTTEWKNIGFITAAGNSSTIKQYSYLHTTPIKSNNYYRILQRDLDGKSSFSEVRMVKLQNTIDKFKINGNPVTDGQLQLTLFTTCTLKLYNSDGTILWSNQFAAGAQTIDLSKYAKGVYLLQAEGQSEKIVVQ